MAILIFVLVLFVLVLVHEFGHFWVAKRMGMRVDEFGIGFPPRIAGIRRGETLYSFNIFPIGGFVRIFGEDARGASARLAEDVSERSDRNSTASGQHRYGEDVSEHNEGGDGDEAPVRDSRSFSSKPRWAQALVLVAGVVANVLFAWLLFVFALTLGLPSAVPPDSTSNTAELYIVDVLPGSPAEQAGIPAGSVVEQLALDERTLTPRSVDAFQAFVMEAGEQPVSVTYRTGSERETVSLTAARDVADDASERPAVGVLLSAVDVVSMPVHRAVVEGFTMTLTGLRDVSIGIFSLLYDALFLRADLSHVAGPVGIVGLVGDASAHGFTILLMFTAVISLNLAIINLLPFPALDGGRLLFVAIEAIKGSAIRPSIAGYLNAAGFILLILLMVAITYNDILRLVG